MRAKTSPAINPLVGLLNGGTRFSSGLVADFKDNQNAG